MPSNRVQPLMPAEVQTTMLASPKRHATAPAGTSKYREHQQAAYRVSSKQGAALHHAEQLARQKLAQEAPAVLGRLQAEAKQKIAAQLACSVGIATLEAPPYAVPERQQSLPVLHSVPWFKSLSGRYSKSAVWPARGTQQERQVTAVVDTELAQIALPSNNQQQRHASPHTTQCMQQVSQQQKAPVAEQSCMGPQAGDVQCGRISCMHRDSTAGTIDGTGGNLSAKQRHQNPISSVMHSQLPTESMQQPLLQETTVCSSGKTQQCDLAAETHRKHSCWVEADTGNDAASIADRQAAILPLQMQLLMGESSRWDITHVDPNSGAQHTGTGRHSFEIDCPNTEGARGSSIRSSSPVQKLMTCHAAVVSALGGNSSSGAVDPMLEPLLLSNRQQL